MKYICLIFLLLSCSSTKIDQTDSGKLTLIFNLIKTQDSYNIELVDKIISKQSKLKKLNNYYKQNSNFQAFSFKLKFKGKHYSNNIFIDNPFEQGFEVSDENGNFERVKPDLSEHESVIVLPLDDYDLEVFVCDSMYTTFIKKIDLEL